MLILTEADRTWPTPGAGQKRGGGTYALAVYSDYSMAHCKWYRSIVEFTYLRKTEF